MGLNSTFKELYDTKPEGPENIIASQQKAKSQDGESMQEGKIPDSIYSLGDEEMGMSNNSGIQLENISVCNELTLNSNREMLSSKILSDNGFLSMKKRINLIPLR